MSSVGASLTGPDTHAALRIEMTVPPTRTFYWRGEQKHEGGVGGRESCGLSEVLNGDFVSLPRVFFFSFSKIKASLNRVQNQHVWPCHEERQSCYLFLSQRSYLGRC